MNDFRSAWDGARAEQMFRSQQHKDSVLELASEVDQIESVGRALSRALVSLKVPTSRVVGGIEIQRLLKNKLRNRFDSIRGRDTRFVKESLGIKAVGDGLPAWVLRRPDYKRSETRLSLDRETGILLAVDGSLWIDSQHTDVQMKGLDDSEGSRYFLHDVRGATIPEKIDLKYCLWEYTTRDYSSLSEYLEERDLKMTEKSQRSTVCNIHRHTVHGFKNYEIQFKLPGKFQFISTGGIYSKTDRSIHLIQEHLVDPDPRSGHTEVENNWQLKDWLSGSDVRIQPLDGSIYFSKP